MNTVKYDILELGSVWCGVHPHMGCGKNIVEVLQLPQKVLPVALIAIGYLDEEKHIKDRFDKSRIHFNKW